MKHKLILFGCLNKSKKILKKCNAKKNGVYAVYMNGGVKKVSKLSSKDIKPGCEIIVPRKEAKEKMSTAEVMAISSGIVTISSIVLTLINLLK